MNSPACIPPPAGDSMVLPPGLQEDRVLNVKAEEFFLGLPGDGAFSQVRTSEGTPLAMTDALRPVASLRRFTKESALALEEALRKLWESS